MDLSNLVVIRSTDSKIPTAEAAVVPKTAEQIQTAKVIEKSTPIDEKFIDKASISADKELKATVLAKQDNGKYLLELDNGKKIELKLPLDLKVMDKVFLQVENSKITNIQVKDIAQTANLNSTSLLKVINNIDTAKALENLNISKLPLTLSTQEIKPQQPILKALISNNLSLNIIPKKIEEPQLLQALKTPEIPKQLNLKTQQIEVPVNSKTISLPIEKIELPKEIIKPFVQVIQNPKAVNKLENLDVKIIQQDNPKQVQVSLNKDVKLDITLTKPENISDKFSTLKPEINIKTQEFNLIKADSKNIIQSIKVEPQVLKNIIEPLKAQLTNQLANQVNQTNTKQVDLPTAQNFPVVIKGNKVILQTVNNLTFKLPIPTEKILPEATKQATPPTIKAEVQFVQNNNKTELVLKVHQQNVKLDNVELELNNKQVNTAVNNLLQTSNIQQSTANTITLKSADFFEIILNVKNNLTNTKNLNFNLNAENKIHLVYPEKSLENPILQAKQTITKEALPHLAKQFAPQLSFMLATAITANKQSIKAADKDSDIFSLLLDSLPDQYKPRLQAAQQNEGWKLFSFPYLQEDEQTKHGQAFYSNQQDVEGNQQTSLAIKVNFSNIGDVMLKFRVLNKNIDLNIYTQIDMDTTDKQELEKTAHQAIAKSGFLGTVAIKKQKTIEIPLLKSSEIVYSGINLKA